MGTSNFIKKMSLQSLPFNLPVGTTIEVVNGGFFIKTSGNKFINKPNDGRYKGITGKINHFNNSRFKRLNDNSSDPSVNNDPPNEDENKLIKVNNIPKKFIGAILGKDGYNSNKLFETEKCYLIAKDGELFIQHDKHLKPDIGKIIKDINKKVSSFKMTKSTEIIKRLHGSKIIGVGSCNKKKLEEKYNVKICINDIFKDEFMKEGRKATFKKNDKGEFVISIDSVAFTWYLKVTSDNLISGEFPKTDTAAAVFDDKTFPDQE